MSRLPESKIPVQISACNMLVGSAQSRRLREMPKSKFANDPVSPHVGDIHPETPAALPAATRQALQHARRIIDDEIVRIMAELPEGRKNRLFEIRFGALQALRAREIAAIFKRLGLDGKRVDLNRLRNINYHGDKIG